MPLIYGLYVPNAPNLIDPKMFGGVGRDTVSALRGLEFPKRIHPDALIVSTPHWVTPTFLVQGSERPRQIYDFSGFPRSLYQVKYEPPGDPALARALVEEGRRRRLDVEVTTDHGLDHGAWAPLLNVAPAAKIPTVPISITYLPPEDHIAWGEAIGRALAGSEKRVAFVGTGSITHRLDRFGLSETEAWPEAIGIEKAIVDLVLAKRYDDLVHFDRPKWETVAPEGDLAPLFTLLGAVGPNFSPRLVHTGQAFGAAGMSTLEFLPE